MKHFYISLAIFIAILTGGFFADRYTKNSAKRLYDQTRRLYQQATAEKVQRLKDDFYDKKNILRFFISAEHIEQLKTYIEFLEHYQSNSDREALQEICIEMAGTLENIGTSTFYIH